MNLDMIVKMIVVFLNGVSIAILIIGVFRALFSFVKNEFIKEEDISRSEKINLIKNILGSYILLSLEVLIATDIIETIMHPTTDDVIILAAIVVIRTFISYFLDKEIEASEQIIKKNQK